MIIHTYALFYNTYMGKKSLQIWWKCFDESLLDATVISSAN